MMEIVFFILFNSIDTQTNEPHSGLALINSFTFNSGNQVNPDRFMNAITKQFLIKNAANLSLLFLKYNLKVFSFQPSKKLFLRYNYPDF